MVEFLPIMHEVLGLAVLRKGSLKILACGYICYDERVEVRAQPA